MKKNTATGNPSAKNLVTSGGGLSSSILVQPKLEAVESVVEESNCVLPANVKLEVAVDEKMLNNNTSRDQVSTQAAVYYTISDDEDEVV